MPFASLRRSVLITAGAVAVAVVVPLSATSAISPASAASAPTAVSTTAVKQTAAQKKAAAKRLAAHKHHLKVVAQRKKIAAQKKAALARGQKIVKVAAKYKGRPYVYGASGPRAFDCSGYTSFVVRQALHVSLPHNAAAQAHSSKIKRVSKSQRKIGDLIFFHGGGGIGHVGIYAGNGNMWDAPNSGDHVKKHKIYSSSVSYGRVR